MRLRTSDATDEIDAEFDIHVGDEPQSFDLTLESAGGALGSGDRRNPDYPLLLEELLRRLSTLDVLLVDALVDSRRVTHLSVEDRRIHLDGRPFPVALKSDDDFHALRRDLTRPQGDIGSAREVGGGNQRKRMKLTFRSASPVTRADLVRHLAAADAPARALKSGIAAGPSREHLEAAMAEWRRLGRDAFLERFQAPAACKYVVVDGEDEIDAMALILGARAIAGLAVNGPWRGDRENVASPLRELGIGVDDLNRPLEGPFGADPKSYVGLSERLGGTDIAIRRIGRREQSYLRGALGIATGDPTAQARCGLCGRHFPHSFLVAAHIKPRHACSEAERLDMPHVGWVLCVAGCDALFEQGYVGVDEEGSVIVLRPDPGQATALKDLAEPLVGAKASGWTAERAGYFRAHRERHASGGDDAL